MLLFLVRSTNTGEEVEKEPHAPKDMAAGCGLLSVLAVIIAMIVGCCAFGADVDQYCGEDGGEGIYCY